jgi:hypothetical protein
VDAELGHQALPVGMDGVYSATQFGCDFLCGAAFGNKLQDFFCTTDSAFRPALRVTNKLQLSACPLKAPDLPVLGDATLIEYSIK